MRKLKLLFAVCALILGAGQTWGQASPIDGVEATTGEFYLYNIGSETYLGNGSSYRTHTIVDGAGKVITIAGSADAYTLHIDGIAETKFLGKDGWVDCETTRDDYSTFTFETATKTGYTNVYKIKANKGGKYMNWAGGSGRYGNEAVFGDSDDDKGLWILIPKATRENYSVATADAPVDVTYLVKNPDMEWDANDEGSATSNWTGDKNFVKQYNNPEGMVANFLERWYGTWNTSTGADNKLNDFDTHQSLANLPAGKYRLTVTAAATQQSGDVDPEGIFVYAGEESTPIKALNTYSVNFKTTGDAVTIGVKTVSTNVNWVRFDKVRLAYLGIDLDLLKEAYANALKAANEVDQTAIMEAAVLTALQKAISDYTTVAETESALKTATDALTTATNNATASISAYANAKTVLEAVAAELETTNVYNKTYYDGIKAAYDDRTMLTADAAALSTDAWADRYGNTYANVLASNWTIGGTVATTVNSGFYINTWSTEGNSDGSDFKTPFYEYWVSDANSLAATTLSTTLTGMAPNATYSLSIRGRVRQTNSKTKIANAVTMQVGNGTAVDISAGDQFKGGQFFIGNFSAIGQSDADGNLKVNITVAEECNVSWLSFRNVKYSDLSTLVTEFGELKGEAEGLLADAAYESITGSERTVLVSAKDATPSTFEEYSSAIDALKDAIDTFKGVKSSYDQLANEIAKATVLGMDATAYAPTATTVATDCTEMVQNLKVAEYEFVSTNYAYAVELGEWNASDGTATNKGQHWDGTSTSTYLEQNSANYNAYKWEISYDQDMTLPAGNYVFKVAGRKASGGGVDMALTVKNGSTVLGTVNDFPEGDTGKGISTDGKTNYAADGTYANNNNGRGWEWRYVQFTLAEPATVTIAVTASATTNKKWVGFCNATVQTDNQNNVDLMEALKALNEAKKVAVLTKITANVGTEAFKYDDATNNALWSAYETARDNVDNFALTATSTASDVNGVISALETATTNYQNQTPNAPTDGQLFNVSLANGKWSYTKDNKTYYLDNEAMTYLAGDRSDAGNYNIKYQAVANQNLAQAFTFTKVEGNNYKMSQIDADGNVRYMCTGVPYGGGTGQIRTTTNAEDAMLVTVIPTATDGKWNLRNVAANQYIGAQDAGVYTVNSHIDFNIVETTKPSITINTTDAGWGTTILPFAVASLPNGVKAYTCAAVDGTKLTLVEVVALEANKPYIIEGSWNETLTGDAQGTALTYTEGLLTGVYVATEVPVGSYVLQKKWNIAGTEEGVGFFKVAEGKQPTAMANRAYLTVSASEARDAFFFDGMTTAIDAIQALMNGEAVIFNTNGVQIPQLQKGMNIIKMENGTIRKVVVK